MFGTSDLSTPMHCLNIQVATAFSHQKRIIEVFILSKRLALTLTTHQPSSERHSLTYSGPQWYKTEQMANELDS